MLLMALLLQLSKNENSMVHFYFGFLNDPVLKPLFLLLCAGLVFPSYESSASVEYGFNVFFGALSTLMSIIKLMQGINTSKEEGKQGEVEEEIRSMRQYMQEIED